MEKKIVPVSRLVNYLKRTLDSDPRLRNVYTEGEISNLRKPYSGHWYFSLKDEKASLSCVMFASSNRRLTFPVQNGDKVIVQGDVSVYVNDGRMQMIVTDMQPSGIGRLFLELEARKKKLAEEGLFAPDHKQPLPRYPQKIALITGNNTAAREDAHITLQRRWPLAEMIDYPAAVQGETAPKEIMAALRKADQDHNDVILLVRGGGSLEDLWCFNDEALVRCIYDLRTPVITGVGHEIDFTLVDFVADARANTPTGAVEMAVPDITDVLQQLQEIRICLSKDMQHRLNLQRQSLNHVWHSPVFQHPQQLLETDVITLQYLDEKLQRYADTVKQQENTLQQLNLRLSKAGQKRCSDVRHVLLEDVNQMNTGLNNVLAQKRRELSVAQVILPKNISVRLTSEKKQYSHLLDMLDAYSPLHVLQRGYSVVKKENQLIKSVQELQIGDAVSVRFADGNIKAAVTGKEIEDGSKKGTAV